MILQGVKQTIYPLEVGYANSPKKAQKGGLCGIFPYIQACVALIYQPLPDYLVQYGFRPLLSSPEKSEHFEYRHMG